MTIEDRRLFALLALALLRPFLGDAADGVDQRLGLHDSTRALLPRSVYSTRGQAIWRTRITGSSVSQRARVKIVSRLVPKRPNSRNGLRMPGDQLTPVMRRRCFAFGHHANAVSMIQGMSSSVSITRRYSKDSISQPAATRRRRKCSLPMVPSVTGLTGAEFAFMAASSSSILGRTKPLLLIRAESGARARPVASSMRFCGGAQTAELGHQL